MTKSAFDGSLCVSRKSYTVNFGVQRTCTTGKCSDPHEGGVEKHRVEKHRVCRHIIGWRSRYPYTGKKLVRSGLKTASILRLLKIEDLNFKILMKGDLNFKTLMTLRMPKEGKAGFCLKK
jgi:hypothetical protein